MSKSRILPATCAVGGIVSVDGAPVTDAEILGEGMQVSSGLLFTDGEVKKYLPAKQSGDLKLLITKISLALDKIATTLTALGAGMPSSTPPPDLATDVTYIEGIKVELDTLKDALK